MVHDRGNCSNITEIISPQFISGGNFCFNLDRANSSLAFRTCEAVL